jgi:hypothetical protein
MITSSTEEWEADDSDRQIFTDYTEELIPQLEQHIDDLLMNNACFYFSGRATGRIPRKSRATARPSALSIVRNRPETA